MAKDNIKKNNTQIAEKKTIAFETLSKHQTLELLKTDEEKGLTQAEAEKRLALYGENKLKEKKKKSWFKIFFEQMNNPMIFVLFAAIAVTIGVSIYESIKDGWDFLETGDWPDVIIILAVILLNAIIGTVQEIKASTSLDALKKLSSPESTVIRDGKRKKIKSSELVIGDIVVLEEGDTIGADIRLLESANMKANESSLTGESVPVEKNSEVTFSSPVGIGDQANMIFMSTPVSYGRGLGVVVATGMNTQIGKIASALDEEENEETPLQKVLAKLSKFLGLLTLVVVIFVLLADIIWIFAKGSGNDIEKWIEAILNSIALAVAAIPEGLAAVVTVVLSIGMQRMVKVNTVVRKLPSVETLGAVSVVCSDKTGTLTQNKMTVVGANVDSTYFEEKDFTKDSKSADLKLLARGMSLCSNATVDEGLYGDPTEIALVNFANQFEMRKKDLEKEFPRVDELPFDSVRKMMSTKHLNNGKNVIFTKGALDSVLNRCLYILDNGQVREINAEDITSINSINSYYSSKALRVLALAYTQKDDILEENLIFIGVVAMIDPPRVEAKPAVSSFKRAGITTAMITGDHKDTAFAIAKDLGIANDINQCMSGKEIDALNDKELQEKVKTCRVFARVSPENKVSIVKAFKANGNICAMTGDGVNDAPSLKAADIGIAMGITGTDVAKSAADMVLTDDNFASIEKAVEEGRNIFANIKKTVLFLLSSNIAEVLTMFIIICLGLPAPLIAIHLLWVNLITDSTPAIALGMDPKDKDIMKEKPRDPKENFFSHGGLFITIGYGAILTLAVLLAYFSCAWLNNAYSYSEIVELFKDETILHQAQTMAFTTLAIGELFHMIGMSDIHPSFVNTLSKKNWMMYIAFGLGVVLQLFVIEVPCVNKIFNTANLTWQEWLVTVAMAIIPIVLHEVIVLIRFIHSKMTKNK